MTLWLVDLLRHMTTECLSLECPQWQESGTEMDKEPGLLRASKLQHGAEELVAEMCRLADSVDRYQRRFSVSPKRVFSRKNV